MSHAEFFAGSEVLARILCADKRCSGEIPPPTIDRSMSRQWGRYFLRNADFQDAAGRSALARSYSDSAAQSLWSRDAIAAGSVRAWATQVYALVGAQELVIQQLDELLSRPSQLSVSQLRLDPLYDPLRDNPRFQALLAKYEK